MLLEKGDKLLVVHRRLFPTDVVRFFTGTVDGYDSGIARVTGKTWVRDVVAGKFVGKPDATTKVLPLSSGNLMAYVLPPMTDMATLRFEIDQNAGVWLTDGAGFKLDLREQWME